MDGFPTMELPLNSGQFLDQYCIEEEIGQLQSGSLTHIYHARDLRNDQEVALKVLALRMDRTHPANHALERFVREIQVMQQLAHPHVMPVLSSGANEYYHWMVMPYCPKKTLAHYLKLRNNVPLPIREACEYATQICAALTLAHSQEPPIIHRDIKPHNMLFTDDYQLLLADFGIAHILNETHLTLYDKAIGTPEYMAPEQFRPRDAGDAEAIDARLDVYALGCVLYELLAGQPPFVGDAPHAIAMAQVRSMPRLLSTRNSAINLGLALIVHRALAKDPDDRYASAAEFAQRLKPFLEE